MKLLRYLWIWAVAVLKHWYGWVGGTTLAIILLFGYEFLGWQPNKKQFVVLLFLGLFCSTFLAWLEQHKARLAAEAAAESNRQNARTRDWSGDWKECADRFKEQANYSPCWADWNNSSPKNEEQWSIVGNKKTRSLCGMAGQLLLASPVVSTTLPEVVRLEADASHRWLTFLKTRGEVSQHDYVLEVADDDGTKHPIIMGRIVNVADSSERVCIDCAATEFQIMRRQ